MDRLNIRMSYFVPICLVQKVWLQGEICHLALFSLIDHADQAVAPCTHCPSLTRPTLHSFFFQGEPWIFKSSVCQGFFSVILTLPHQLYLSVECLIIRK